MTIKKGGVRMKRPAKVFSVVILVLFVLVNIPNIAICFVYSMPDDAKEDSVCFLAPELTWNSTITDVRGVFGEPIETVSENGDALDDVLGRIKRYTFSAVFENHPMEVRTTSRSFSPFTLFRRKKVYKYTFVIECNSEQDERDVFDRLGEMLVRSKASDSCFHYSKEDNKLLASTYYGPIWADYIADYEIMYEEGGVNEVVFKIDSVFDL